MTEMAKKRKEKEKVNIWSYLVHENWNGENKNCGNNNVKEQDNKWCYTLINSKEKKRTII